MRPRTRFGATASHMSYPSGTMGAMSTWVDAPWLGFDTETTGLSRTDDRIVTAAAVERPGGLEQSGADKIETWLADPGIEIPERAAQVHGISTEYAREHGRQPAQVLEEINSALAGQLTQGGPVIVFNAGFDLPLLAADSKRHGVPSLESRIGGVVQPILDPLVLDRAVVPRRRGKRTLTDLCGHYGVTVPADTHQAHVDAQITLLLLAAMLRQHSQLTQMSPSDLDRFQRESHARWAKSLQDWHARQGRDRRISPVWF